MTGVQTCALPICRFKISTLGRFNDVTKSAVPSGELSSITNIEISNPLLLRIDNSFNSGSIPWRSLYVGNMITIFIFSHLAVPVSFNHQLSAEINRSTLLPRFNSVLYLKILSMLFGRFGRLVSIFGKRTSVAQATNLGAKDR